MKQPPLYQVALTDTSSVPIEFVMALLMEVFGLDEGLAEGVAIVAQHTGRGYCGSFSKEMAETKIDSVSYVCRKIGFTVGCEIKKETVC